jgi:hypothetical protein
MMKTKIASAVLGTLAATHLYATETYNVEAGVTYGTSATDSNTETSGTTLSGTYYLKPVAIDSTQPFMELDFLQKASSLTLSYSDLSAEAATLSKTTLNPLGIIGNFYVDDFVFGFSHSNWNAPLSLKSDPALKYDSKFTSTGIRVGYRVVPNTVISFNTEQSDSSYTRNSSTLQVIADVKTTSNGIRSYTVTSLGNNQSVVFDLSYQQIKQEQTKTETNNEYAANVRFYPQANYFIEGGYSLNNGDNASDKGSTYVVGAGYSITPRLGVLVSTSNFNGEESAEKSSSRSTNLTVGYRF